MRPGLVDEIDDRAVGFVSGRGEDADGFVEEEVAGCVGLEDFAVRGEMVEFSERNAAVGDRLVIEEDLSGIEKFFGMTFSESAVFGDELGDVHNSSFFYRERRVAGGEEEELLKLETRSE